MNVRRGWCPWSALRLLPDILVHRCRLDEGVGWWCPQERVILLDDRLDSTAARCVLAHELAHAVLGHGMVAGYRDDSWLMQRWEREADRWAAAHLVHGADLIDALQDCYGQLRAMAEVLGVTSDVLDHRLAQLSAGEVEGLGGSGRSWFDVA